MDVVSEERRQLGDRSAVIQTIGELDAQLESLRRESQLTETEEKTFRELSETQSLLAAEKESLDTRLFALTTAKDEYLCILGDLSETLSKQVRDRMARRVPQMDERHRTELEEIATRIGERLAQELNRAIDDEFRVIDTVESLLDDRVEKLEQLNDKIQPFLNKVQNRSLLEDLQKQMQEQLDKLQQMDRLDTEIDTLKSRLSVEDIIAKYQQRLEAYQELADITHRFGRISDDITVGASVEFDRENFRRVFLEQIHMRVLRQQMIEVAAVAEDDYDFEPNSHIEIIATAARSIVEGSVILKKGYNRSILTPTEG